MGNVGLTGSMNRPGSGGPHLPAYFLTTCYTSSPTPLSCQLRTNSLFLYLKGIKLPVLVYLYWACLFSLGMSILL